MPEKLDQSELDSIRRVLQNEDGLMPQWFVNDVEALLDEHASLREFVREVKGESNSTANVVRWIGDRT